MKSSLHLLIILLCFTGCSGARVIRLKSVPEGATVTAVDGMGERVLGKTPLELESAQLPTDGRFFSLSFNKEGHQDHHLLVGLDERSENYDISVKLRPQGDDPKVTDTRSRQERLAKLLLQAHALTAAKKYEEAERTLGILQQEFPHVSATHDLMGNFLYLKRDLKTALNFYERSLQINPENVETKQMVDRLKGMIQQ